MAIARARRRFADRARPGGAIVLYHRIASPPRDPWELAVSAERLREQLDVLASSFTVLPLRELARRARRRRLPERAVAITFDDGYVDNLDLALPELERRGLPATVFVPTAYVGAPGPFWWDELEELVAGGGERPPRLELPGAPPLDTSSLQARTRALAAVQPLLRHGRAEDIEPTLARLRAWAGTGAGRVDPGARCVTRAELERLARAEVIEIGAHTRTHPGLAAQPPAVARAEIEGSRDELAEWLGEPPATFSYPMGDNRPATRRLARAAGFELAVAVAPPGPVSWLGNRYALPRQMALEEPAERFEERIQALTR